MSRRKRGGDRKAKNLNLSAALVKRADELARKRGQYLSDLVEQALEAELNRQ